ncbi:hypothetical protein EDB92DRAFT_85898 [Lactarius akahatsu]|uniref:Uncharacterized protein n=1 Tax=Lactarius akahatsu TaxID=416441 RepID=A0AAD4LRB7_9AGAM|nr:hypothetical protein EDB92DRAFT_85898 [Lactarius akahatsu]
MSSTKQAVRNAATALKKAADPWSKEGRVTADRVASAAISVIDATTLGQGVLEMLSTLLRRPFAELYSTHPGTSLRLSAAILATIIYDRIVPSWKSGDFQRKNDWEQVATVLLAGVQDHVECHSDDRVKTMVAQAFYSILCNAFFSASTPGPLTKYSVPLRVSAYSLLSTTADSCPENKDKLRDNKILGGTRLGRVITMTKALEQLLILLAYLLPHTSHTVGRVVGRPERLRFLHDCFDESTELGKELIDLLKYVASPDWEITSDKIVDILARDIAVAQPFVMNSFALRGVSGTRLSPVHRFYLDKTTILFNFEDEDGKIEGMHVPYSSVEHVDISSSGIVAAQLALPPLCHDSLQILSDGAVIQMTVALSPPDVQRFAKTLRARGMTSRIKMDGVLIRNAAERISINRSPTRLEFDLSAKGSASYQSKVKVIEEGVFQASDPGDDIVPYPEDCADELQHEFPLPVKECPTSATLRRVPATITTEGEKITDDGGCNHVSPASHPRLSDVHENPQQCSTTASLALGPPSPPGCLDGPSLHTPGTSGVAHQCFDVDNPSPVHSPPSEHSQHSCHSNKELSDAIFGASDEDLSSLSDADSVLGTVRASAKLVQTRRARRETSSSKRCALSKRLRSTPLSTEPTPAVPLPGPTQDAAAEQKLAPVVKGLRVMSQDTMREELLETGGRNPAASTKRKKILIESGDEFQATNQVTPTLKESPLPMSNIGPKNEISQTKRRSRAVVAAQAGRTATERPKRTCVLSTAKIKARLNPLPSAAPDRPDLEQVNAKKDPAEGDDESADDESQKGKLAKTAAEERVTARAVQMKRPNTEKDIPSVSDNAKPRKRARVDRENVASTRKKPTRNKKGTSVSKPESPRVQKTYRRRQKAERSSPGHPANRDVDYDEVPPSTVQLSSLIANERKSLATQTATAAPIPRAPRKGKNGKITPPVAKTKPTVEVPNDKGRASNEKPNECNSRTQIQCPPAASVLEDEDPIQSFSSSPHSPSLMPVDMVKSALETRSTSDAEVPSLSLPGAESHAETVDTAPSAIAQTCNPKNEVTEIEFEKDTWKATSSCDATLRHSTALSERLQPQPSTATRPVSTCSTSASPLPQGLVRPPTPGGVFDIAPCDNSPSTADRDDKNTRGSSNPLTDFDSVALIDGPTIAVEQPSVEQKKDADATFSHMPVTIDLTGDTPSPIHSPRSGLSSLGKSPFSHHVGTSSPVVSGDGTSENTGSSLLDLTDTKYRDFDVPLDSSYCLPSTRTSLLKRSPTPPPRTKAKNVTFALPAEEVDEEQLQIPEAPMEVIAPVIRSETDELKYLELAFEQPRGNGSSSSVDGLDPQLTTKPQAIPTSYYRVGKAAGPSSLLSSPVALRRNRSRPSGGTLSTVADPNNRHCAREASLLPTMVEPMAQGKYLDSIMAVRTQNIARYYLSRF